LYYSTGIGYQIYKRRMGEKGTGVVIIIQVTRKKVLELTTIN
jgi:hypothetical protein